MNIAEDECPNRWICWDMFTFRDAQSPISYSAVLHSLFYTRNVGAFISLKCIAREIIKGIVHTKILIRSQW